MALYAVHYAWIDGHSVKAPVGIWGDGGVSFYPAETESHRSGGKLLNNEAGNVAWSDLVEFRTEWGSTYGASWQAVESDQSMEAVLMALRSEFFSTPHPINMLPNVAQGGDSDPEGKNLEDRADSADVASEALKSEAPAPRFVIAQSWWIASELVRRHPELVLHEMHPGGGAYDVLAAFTLPYDSAKVHIMLNRAGTMQVHFRDGRNGVPDEVTIGTWADALSAGSPHAIVKRVEEAAQLNLSAKAPTSTPRALAYRFIASVLTMTVNDRHTWDARNEFIDSSGDWWPGDPEVNGYLREFPQARRDFVSTQAIGLWHEPDSHFWAILRDDVAVAIVSIEGRIYTAGGTRNVAQEYAVNGRRMLPLVADVFKDVLE